jgi:hypothetical protein
MLFASEKNFVACECRKFSEGFRISFKSFVLVFPRLRKFYVAWIQCVGWMEGEADGQMFSDVLAQGKDSSSIIWHFIRLNFILETLQNLLKPKKIVTNILTTEFSVFHLYLHSIIPVVSISSSDKSKAPPSPNYKPHYSLPTSHDFYNFANLFSRVCSFYGRNKMMNNAKKL